MKRLNKSSLPLSNKPWLNPRFKSIVVIGTNGKGSTAQKIAYGLEKSGYSVGLFTSPHLLSVTERIKINSKPIPFPLFSHYLTSIPYEKNWFWHLFQIAVHYFSDQNIDIAVFEAGIGARKDPISLLDPILTVFTSIDMDHMDVLGYTKEKITLEKAALLKQKSLVVVNSKALSATLAAVFLKNRVNYRVAKACDVDYCRTNTYTAYTALELLQKQGLIKNSIDFDELYDVLPCGRFQRIFDDVYLDVAHNFQGFEALFSKLRHRYPKKLISVILGGYKDKNFLQYFETQNREGFIIYVDGENGDSRMMEKTFLFDALKEMGYKNVFVVKNPIQEAFNRKKEDDPLVVTGGFKMVEKAMRLFKSL